MCSAERTTTATKSIFCPDYIQATHNKSALVGGGGGRAAAVQVKTATETDTYFCHESPLHILQAIKPPVPPPSTTACTEIATALNGLARSEYSTAQTPL